MWDRTLWITVGTIFLVLLVTSTDWIGLAALLTGGMRVVAGPEGPEVRGLGRQFVVMLFNPSPVWDVLRASLAGLVAVLAASSIASDRINVRGGAVMIALGVSLIPMLILFFYFTDTDRGDQLIAFVRQGAQNDADGADGKSDAFYPGWNAHLTSQLQLTFAHLALFFGVKKQADAARQTAAV